MTDETKPDGAAVRIPPPIVPVLGLAAGFVLSWSVGPLPNPLGGAPRFVLGGLLVGAGLGLMAAAIGLFRATGQDPKPWESSPELIATGIYRYTRNPMYLAMGLLQGGLGILFAELWSVVLVPVTWTVIYFIAIRHEEAYLAEKFGAPYLEYKGRVRRWL